MTTYDLTATPNAVQMRLLSNTALSVSAMIGSAQTVDRGGYKWLATYTYNSRIATERGDLLGTLAALRGMANRLRVPVHDNEAGGAYGGTPLVAGAGQTGSSIDIDGCSSSITKWIAKGDYFSIVINGEPELKMCTADAATDGGGLATITFEPRLRAAPADNAVIYVEDGVLTKPSGIFLLANAENGWSSNPHRIGEISSITLELVEDVFATQ